MTGVSRPQQGLLRGFYRDGSLVTQLQCPECGGWADIDDDQLHGRVSVNHVDAGCTFHETRDWFNTAERAPGATQ